MSIIREAQRFIVIGVASTFLNYALFFLLYRVFHANYVFSSISGYVVGLIFGYVYNRSWTFRSVRKNRTEEAVFYISTYAFSLAVSVVVLRMFVEQFGIAPLLANVFAIGVSTVSNFIGSKFLVFNEKAVPMTKRIFSLMTPAFLFILGVKIVASFLFGSHFATEGFIPFVSYFVQSFANPYNHFAAAGLNVFPYPAGMLFLESIPFLFAKYLLPASLFANINFQLFLLRIPVIVLDVLIYFILCYLLPRKEKKVLWLYFASPILFYISYFHGQLDVIPTAFLLLSLFALFRAKEKTAFVILGLGMAMKTHLIAALPFYMIYFYRNKTGAVKIVGLLAFSAAAFLVVNPYLISAGFIQTVFHNAEQQRIFNLFVPFGFNGLEFLITPAAILLLLYRFISYKKINKDFLLVTLGILYTVLISLVPPMQGWFYWSLPFLVFFFVKFRGAPMPSFWAMNIFFILYFAFVKDSDIFQGLSPLWSAAEATPDPFWVLTGMGINATLLVNLLFTGLETSLIMSAWWVYKMGSSSNRLYQAAGKPFVLGIGGDSGVGKTRLAHAVEQIVGARNVAHLCGDDVHKWERGHENWNVITHLNPKGSNVHLDLEHIEAFLRGENVERPVYDHRTGTFSQPVVLEPKRFVVFEGLMPFVLDHMRQLFSFKIYIEADEELRVKWKVDRDSKDRARNLEVVRKQIEERKPDAAKFIHPQKEIADFIVKYSRSGDEVAMECSIRNSIFVENIIEELVCVDGLVVEHLYVDLNFQKIIFRGEISKEKIEGIAYKLFPTVSDVVENYPQFENGFEGILQLFFIGVINNFYKAQSDNDE